MQYLRQERLFLKLTSIKNWMGPYPNGPLSCDRAIRYSGYFGVRSVGPVGDFLDHWFTLVSYGSQGHRRAWCWHMLKPFMSKQIRIISVQSTHKKTIIGFLRGGCPRGGGNWGTRRIPREDWGASGNITAYWGTPPLGPSPLNNPIKQA